MVSTPSASVAEIVGTTHQPRLLRGPRPSAMHGRAVVPHDHVASAPLVQVGGARRGRGLHQFVDQLLPRCRLHAFDCIGVRGKINSTAAVHRILPHHAPALRRQRRALLGGCEVRRDLAARMRIVVPGKGILELHAQACIEPLKGKAGRDVFGLAAARRDDARRKDRCERR